MTLIKTVENEKYKWHSVMLLGMARRNFRDIPKKKKKKRKTSWEIAVNNTVSSSRGAEMVREEVANEA